MGGNPAKVESIPLNLVRGTHRPLAHGTARCGAVAGRAAYRRRVPIAIAPLQLDRLSCHRIDQPVPTRPVRP